MLPGRLLEAAGDRRPRGMIAARLFGNRIRLTATPDAQKGAHMPRKPADDEKTKDQEQVSTSGTPSARRKFFRLGLLVPVLLVAVVLFLLYGLDHLSSTIRSAKRAVSDRKLGPLFTRMPADQLLSSDDVLRAVGRGPVDPGRVLSPAIDKVSEAGSEKKPAAGSSSAEDAVEQEGKTKPAPAAEGGQVSPETGPQRVQSPPGSPPAVEARGPGFWHVCCP